MLIFSVYIQANLEDDIVKEALKTVRNLQSCLREHALTLELSIVHVVIYCQQTIKHNSDYSSIYLCFHAMPHNFLEVYLVPCGLVRIVIFKEKKEHEAMNYLRIDIQSRLLS